MPSKRLSQTMGSPRAILTIVTIVVLVIIVFASRHELYKAWILLGDANLSLLALLIPFQVIVYYAGGEMIFSYLRRKKLIGHVSRFEQTRIALELNLVNHIFPSGGVSGMSYTAWRLHKLGVSAAKSTFAQVVRYVSGFVALMAILVVAVLVLAIDGEVNRYIVASSFVLVLVVVSLVAGLMVVFSSRERMTKSAKGIARIINSLTKSLSLGKIKQIVSSARVEKFFIEMHRDFGELSEDKRLLVAPLAWGAIYAIFDVLMFMVAFWSLGASVNPAILIVGYGVAGLAAIVALTPGGAGVYEVIMIFFLTMAGVNAEVAIAGIVLTRAVLMTGTIVFGYIFYQHALWKYGKHTDTTV